MIYLALALAAATPHYETEVYDDIALEVSPKQDNIRSARFYVGKSADYWTPCSGSVTITGRVRGIKYAFPKEVSEFTLVPVKGEPVTFTVIIDSLPESRKWILSTMIRPNAAVITTSRACGSGAIPYLISIKRKN